LSAGGLYWNACKAQNAGAGKRQQVPAAPVRFRQMRGRSVMSPFSVKIRAWPALLLIAALYLPAQSLIHSALMTERFGKPYVMVTIGGRGPYRFIIDTGTGADAFVSPALADELQLPAVAEVVLSDPSGQGERRVPMV